ncbi:unannotated protein [freshwater metagenome]|uniref:Unannotated protein n=1 Tax=freshwater metagenome TaxID=449393 RepID=A0A6J6U5J2_9ZZZZ
MSTLSCNPTVHRTSMTRGSHAVTRVVERSLGGMSDPLHPDLPLPTDTTTTGPLR